MNARELKNTRKRTLGLVNAIEAQIKKLEGTLKSAKSHLKEVDTLIADNTKLSVAKKNVKAEKPAKAAKPAKEVKAAKAEKPAKTGDRPTLVEAIKIVMGNKVMNAEAVLAALTEKGWAPGAQDKKTYTSYLLSSNKDVFERVPDKGRGFYRVADVKVKAAAPKAEAKAEVKAEAPKAEAKAEAKVEAPKAEAPKAKKDKAADDKILADLGVTAPDAANPFGG
jgi:ribonuclease E